MTQYVNIPLSESQYRQLKQWADSRQQEVGEALAEYLLEALPPAEAEVMPLSEAEPHVVRERAAYVRLHPQLKRQYAGQYVAIYQGELVDHDADFRTLFERIDDRYPDEFVWLTRVEEEPIRTVTFRSPRWADK